MLRGLITRGSHEGDKKEFTARKTRSLMSWHCSTGVTYVYLCSCPVSGASPGTGMHVERHGSAYSSRPAKSDSHGKPLLVFTRHKARFFV